MSTSNGALSHPAHHRPRSSRTAAPRSFARSLMLAGAALGCGAALYTVLAHADLDSAAVSPAVLVAADTGGTPALFADRFSPVLSVAAIPAARKKKNVYVALLDPTYSMGAPAARFADRTYFGLEGAASASAVASASASAAQADVAALKDVSPLTQQEIREVAANVPLPPARPSELRLPAVKGPSAREIVQANRATGLSDSGFPGSSLASATTSIFEKLFGKQPSGPVLAYASPDGGVFSDGRTTTDSKSGIYDRSTAVYDISARTVYMPDGTKLEAHSGLGSRLDDPRFVHEKMRGATPPHVYDLTMRETLFHGVPAIRLTPVGGEGAIYGRTGLLAHTYMLGPNGDSNGCVSFKDYNAFLQAYRSQRVKRLVVVAKL